MKNARFSSNLDFKSKKERDVLRDTRLTNCSICKAGIFPRHKYVWTKKGLVHDYCEIEVANETEDVTAALSP